MLIPYGKILEVQSQESYMDADQWEERLAYDAVLHTLIDIFMQL